MTVAKSLEIFNNDFIRNLTSQNDINYNDFIEYPTVLYIRLLAIPFFIKILL
ncbi:hypothetical protein [Spiroplasma poulsonii]|nr:hypothetical protein [Spiroplasma poulsonii]